MAERNVVKPRKCWTCQAEYEMTAEQIKVHGDNCRQKRVGPEVPPAKRPD